MKQLDAMANRKGLWLLFAATLLITSLFPYLAQLYSLSFIDALSDPEATRQYIAGLTADQRSAHAWITATVDVAYPLAYGSFFAASARCFFPSRFYLALPGLIVIPVDCLEGLVQVLALTDVVDWLAAKAVLTPLKFGLFYAGFAIAFIGWLTWIYRKIRN
ncbi:MAG: hypothetical protein RIC89_22565 [Pseudomonadales bacterium]